MSEKPGDAQPDKMTAEKYINLNTKEQAAWSASAGYQDKERIHKESGELTKEIEKKVVQEVHDAGAIPPLSDGLDVKTMTAEQYMDLSVRDKALYQAHMHALPDEDQYSDQYQGMQAVIKRADEMRQSAFAEAAQEQAEHTVDEEVDASEVGSSGPKMPKGMGKKFGSDTDKEKADAQEASGEEFKPQGPVHESSHSQAGHFSVVDTDGAALNRHTNDYMQRKFSETLEKSEDYQEIDKDAKAADAAITALQEKREADKKKEEEDGVSEEEKKKAEEAYQEELQALKAKKEEHEKERRQFYEEHCRLNEQEQNELRQHLTEAINKEYPNSLEPREENGVDVYENKSGTLNCKHRDDGKVELSVPKGSKFSGVVRVPRVDANGAELEECDMIEYKNGQAVSVVAGRQGQSAIVDLDKILEQSKGHGVQVGAAEEQEQSVAVAKDKEDKGESQKKTEAEQAAENVEEKMVIAGRMIAKSSLATGDQDQKDEDKKSLVEAAARHLAEAVEKGALEHTNSAGLENFTKEDRAKVIEAARNQLSSTDKRQGLELWEKKNNVMDADPSLVAQQAAVAAKPPVKYTTGADAGNDMNPDQDRAAKKFVQGVMKKVAITREAMAANKAPSQTPAQGAGKAKEASVAAK